MNSEALAKSQELADELRPTEKVIGQLAERYCELKAAQWVVLTTGEKLTQKQMTDELAFLAKQLRESDYLPVYVEGHGFLKLQPRSSWTFNNIARIREDSPLLFDELLQTGCLTIDIATAKRKELFGSIKPYGDEGGTTALVIERDK